MLHYLELKHTGPSEHMRLDFAPRLNILTGDNGLGKTFLLDVAWWALTQSWPGEMAWPRPRERGIAEINYSCSTSISSKEATLVRAQFGTKLEKWLNPAGASVDAGLLLYMRVDGSFSLWDPVRNMHEPADASNLPSHTMRPPAFHFRNEEIWNGLRSNGNVFCEGLLSDWRNWKISDGPEFQLLREVLLKLSPSEAEKLEPGDFQRLSINDVRDIPTIVFPYGPVPVSLASAGMKRIISLAYLITWIHTEHLNACNAFGKDSARQLTILIDEVEAHLHPQWQRVILPSMLSVVEGLANSLAPTIATRAYPQIQIIASTHAPLVLASIEPEFDEARDRVFHFGVEQGVVRVEELPWAKQGDAVNWLVSETFGLRQARSREAETVIEEAEAFMRNGAKDATTSPDVRRERDAIHQRLMQYLPDHDPFWPRWVVQTGQR
ncbi:MAG: AAA family ATPase [Candidatus Hydrogenedentes bacterium]|nr:AAA family ATPase [Candidatus Hydrogenedentota bacterium]